MSGRVAKSLLPNLLCVSPTENPLGWGMGLSGYLVDLTTGFAGRLSGLMLKKSRVDGKGPDGPC
jgi:hypothetical protein